MVGPMKPYWPRLQMTRQEDALLVRGPEGAPTPLRLRLSQSHCQQQFKTIQHRQPLLKAFKCHQEQRQHYLIYDATTGLGQDSLRLLYLGFQVYSVEVHPALYHIVAQAKAQHQSDHTRLQQWQLHHGDSQTHHPPSSPAINGIFLDPMFKQSKHSALPNHQMQWIQYIHHTMPLPPQLSEHEWFAHLSTIQPERIVIKRAQYADYFAQRSPTYQVPMKGCRLDVYCLS